jgi:hypothetical protein
MFINLFDAGYSLVERSENLDNPEQPPTRYAKAASNHSIIFLLFFNAI